MKEGLHRVSEISRFFGIIISMYHNEHNPPHFHAKYNEFIALISIDSLSILSGYLPPRVMGLVIEWAAIHRCDLMKQWDRGIRHEEFEKLEPLK